jgi:phosphoglycolate phosphatase
MPAVLFWDIDGTLLTTARAGIFALEEAAREVCGAAPDFSALHTAGLTDWEVAVLCLETVGADSSPAVAARLLRRYEAYLPTRLHYRRGSVLPGVREALDDLTARDGVSNLLLTGNTAAGARAKLEHYDLARYFADGAFCEDGDDRTAIARRAHDLARRRGNGEVDVERVAVIGDTPADVRCGQAIGARTVAIASGSYSAADLDACGPTAVFRAVPDPSLLLRALGP